jgi:CHAT domain-containing protein
MVETQKTGQQYQNFIKQVLQLMVESDSDPQIVYPLLQQNVSLLDDEIVEWLKALEITKFAENNKAVQELLARHIGNLGVLIQEFTQGQKAVNMELSIACSDLALQVYTVTEDPEDWARIQQNLGGAYLERIRGDRTKNLERAIQCLEASLEVRTEANTPKEWAKTQQNLGNAYAKRITGDRVENLELSIQFYKAALEVRTEVDEPIEWAMTQNNLGLSYNDRIKGDRVENLEKSIQCLEEALKVRAKEVCPTEWAMTQNNLANVYLNRIKGNRVKNLERSIFCGEFALEKYTKIDYPTEWAMTQNSLGNAYSDRIIGDRAENLEQAIECYQLALEVRTEANLPLEWAETQNNLGNAYTKRISGNRSKNLEQAIAAHQNALKVYTLDAFPQTHATFLRGLGIAYQETNQLILAHNTFKSAIDTVDHLREEIVSGEESKRKQAEDWNGIYGRMVKICLELDNQKEALEYVERSKTRNLVELILTSDSKTIFPPEVFTQLEIYRDEIAIGQDLIQTGKAENPKVLAQHLQQLRQQRNNSQNRYLPVGYSFKFDSFQATLDEHAAIVEWYVLNDRILAFIIKSTGEVTVWESQQTDREDLGSWANRYIQNYYQQKAQWQKGLGEELKKLASILHLDEILTLIPEHCDRLILIPHWFLHLFPLHALPVSQSPENSYCLLDKFPNGVSYAPSCQIIQQLQQRDRHDFQSLFAIQNPTGDLDYSNLELQVIKSCFNISDIFENTQATISAINRTNLNNYHCIHFSCHGYFNLINPSQSLLVLANSPISDTPPKIDSESYLKLPSGEIYDLKKCLTLDKIFALELEKCYLVTLSACETGLIDFNNTSDEYIGLPSGFLYAGASSVVSSLWTVDDLSTAFLMIRFYQNLHKDLTVALALNQAQLWLKDLTRRDLEIWIEESQLALKPAVKMNLRRRLYKLDDDAKPFKSPFYWAAFCAIGQ